MAVDGGGVVGNEEGWARVWVVVVCGECGALGGEELFGADVILCHTATPMATTATTITTTTTTHAPTAIVALESGVRLIATPTALSLSLFPVSPPTALANNKKNSNDGAEGNDESGLRVVMLVVLITVGLVILCCAVVGTTPSLRAKLRRCCFGESSEHSSYHQDDVQLARQLSLIRAESRGQLSRQSTQASRTSQHDSEGDQERGGGGGEEEGAGEDGVVEEAMLLATFGRPRPLSKPKPKTVRLLEGAA